MTGQDHDGSYKRLFSFPQMVKSILQDWVPGSWVAELDFTAMTLGPDSYTADKAAKKNKATRRDNDRVWKIKFRDTHLYVVLMLEFQSTVDEWMALRINTYTGLLYQRLIEAEEIKKGDKLPPIFPIVLYNGVDDWTAAQETETLFSPVSGQLAEFIPRHRYFLIHEKELLEQAKHKKSSLTACLFRLEHSEIQKEMPAIVAELYRLLPGNHNEGLLRAFITMIYRHILGRRKTKESDIVMPKTPLEAQAMMEITAEKFRQKNINIGMQKGMQKGMQEGMQEGMQRGMQEGMQNEKIAIARKLIPMMVLPAISEITGLSLEELEKLRSEVEQ